MNDGLDVVLIHHPTSDLHRPILFPAMGLFSLADQLDRNGIRTEIVHLGLEKLVDPGFDAVDYVASSGARIVALSIHWFFQLPDSLALAREIKKRDPGIVVLAGGFTASFFARDLLKEHGYLDAVIRGDGERPLLDFCRTQLQGKPGGLEGVPNLVHRSRGREVVANPFDYVITQDEFDGCNFSNLKLLRHHDKYLSMVFLPTRRFRDRFPPGRGGVFPLETGRGCPYGCSFCGGNREAQKRINNRKGFLFRSPDSVLGTIREVMDYGCDHFYICFDPDLGGDYYRNLFRQIRKEKIKMRMSFGCWGLPGIQFLDEFRDTFVDGSFEISPETASETLRHANKGKVSFTNDELRNCLDHIGNRNLACQLFFGYFLPGDTAETVMETQRFARALESDRCESFYLAFSTDPASLLYLHPEKYDVDIDLQSLKDYEASLSKDRASPNLLAHRPASLSPEKAHRIIMTLGFVSFACKVFPKSIRSIGMALGDHDQAEKLVEGLCQTYAEKPGLRGMGASVSDITGEFKKAIGEQAQAFRNGSVDLLGEIIDYESLPYLLMEEHFSKTSSHYSVYCTEKEMDGTELSRFIESNDTVVAERVFQHDLLRILKNNELYGVAYPERKETRIGLAVNPRGQVAVFYPERIGRAG